MLRPVISTRTVTRRRGGTYEESMLRHDLVCDVCGAVAVVSWQHQVLWHVLEESDTAEVIERIEARDRARRTAQAGWSEPTDDGLDLCPTCEEPPL